tara:strand:- start:771 stop:1199 length:429 start_codon:yes stop_codon:yes gene_type:complete
LLKSRKPRIIIRRSLKNITIQVVEYYPKGDKVLMTISSKELEKSHGLKTSRKNISSAYLTGILAGKKAQEKKIDSGIADMGLRAPHKKGVLMAALKGLIDSGMDIPYKKSDKDLIFPSEERLKGNHLKNKIEFGQIKEKINK